MTNPSSMKSYTTLILIRSPIKIKQAINPLGEMSVLEESPLTKIDIFSDILDLVILLTKAAKSFGLESFVNFNYK